MIPGLGGMNPAQMKAMMRQLGIKSEDIDASKVTIETTNGKRIVFDSPNVTAVDMKGSKTYTITGESREEEGAAASGEKTFPKEDIEMVMDQTNSSEEDAIEALEENDGDIAEAITQIKNKE